MLDLGCLIEDVFVIVMRRRHRLGFRGPSILTPLPTGANLVAR